MPHDRRHIDGPVHCRVLDKDAAKGFAPLGQFCCGHCALDPSALEVNRMIAQAYTDTQAMQAGALRTIIVLLDQHHTLLGAAGLDTENQAFPDTFPGAAFIQAYGRERHLKGYALADHSTSVGDALLRACLELGIHLTDGPDIPDAWALTHFDNTASHAALRRLGFDPYPGQHFQGPDNAWHYRYILPSDARLVHDQQLWRRPASPALDPLPADVYMGPLAPPPAPATAGQPRSA